MTLALELMSESPNDINRTLSNPRMQHIASSILKDALSSSDGGETPSFNEKGSQWAAHDADQTSLSSEDLPFAARSYLAAILEDRIPLLNRFNGQRLGTVGHLFAIPAYNETPLAPAQPDGRIPVQTDAPVQEAIQQPAQQTPVVTNLDVIETLSTMIAESPADSVLRNFSRAFYHEGYGCVKLESNPRMSSPGWNETIYGPKIFAPSMEVSITPEGISVTLGQGSSSLAAFAAIKVSVYELFNRLNISPAAIVESATT